VLEAVAGRRAIECFPLHVRMPPLSLCTIVCVCMCANSANDGQSIFLVLIPSFRPSLPPSLPPSKICFPDSAGQSPISLKCIPATAATDPNPPLPSSQEWVDKGLFLKSQLSVPPSTPLQSDVGIRIFHLYLPVRPCVYERLLEGRGRGEKGMPVLASDEIEVRCWSKL